MPKRDSPYARLEHVPLDELVATVVDKLRHATLDELGAMLGKTTVVPTLDELAAMIIARPETGSKLEVVLDAVVLRAFALCGENASAAARLLGVERVGFMRKLVRARRRVGDGASIYAKSIHDV